MTEVTCTDVTEACIQTILNLALPSGATVTEVATAIAASPGCDFTEDEVSVALRVGAKTGVFCKTCVAGEGEWRYMVNAFMVQLGGVRNKVYNRDGCSGAAKTSYYTS